jgi:hypothetical protein
VSDRAASIHQQADLAADLAADLGQLAGDLVRDEAIAGQAASVESLERADLAGLEAMGVAGDLDVGSWRAFRGGRTARETAGA